MAETNGTTTTEEESRYNQLILLVDKALTHSRKDFDIDEAIKECYGEDASMFETKDSSEENFLVSAINAMIDDVNKKVKKGFLDYLEKEEMKQKLDKLEAIIAKLDQEDEQMKQADEQDRRTAQAALDATRLPKGVTPDGLMRYHIYNKKKEDLALMEKKLAEEEAAIEKLSGQIRNFESIEREGKENMEQLKQTLQREEQAVKAWSKQT
ncbi:expressed unknown protein [Seminavis robusta]|uniref:Uncharacterized protein n=1 Tax=Seminavis robusta TaxID=568900 RepID=A0A9N8EB57_9STRA|nr:expressed unknown protein [Seminavis robusta]|eukprot:Sro868_g213310.1 n/a (210) ;mRNA; r:25207-25836